ncbi:tetratricopeptide repeat-containing glycosyltransferase family 2 protein [Paenibacillus sp. y28]|uniref:tetratricopeptide repeat-containing glycosyltransferase family 2 protein n=1 Tax=Paenibacillus sp. y28 TaxID=3129110 RepID=UPI00301A86FD
MEKLISLCMIVKNEEKVLRRCLASAAGLADEIIIVDTGSTDATKKIASEFTDLIFDFEWTNDFSAARNESIKHATGRWILYLDADEYLDQATAPELRRMLSSLDASEPLGIVLPIMNMMNSAEENKQRVYRSSATRLFTNGHQLYFTRPIHEQVTCPNGNLKDSNYNSFFIYHSGYTAEVVKEKNKSERNMAIFDELKTKSNTRTPYDCFTLANQYFSIQDYKKALYYYERAYKRAKSGTPFLPYCVDKLIRIHFILQRYKDAEDYIQKGLQLWGQWPDFHFMLGELYELCGFYKKAEDKFEETIRLAEQREAENPSYCLIHLEYGKIMPYEKLTRLYLNRRDLPKTVFALTKVLNLNTQHYQALFQLASILSQNEKDNDIITFFSKLYPLTKATNLLLLFKIFTLLGHRSLSQYFYTQYTESGMDLHANDVVGYALVTRNKALFEGASLQLELSPENGILLMIAAILWGEESYLSQLRQSTNEELAPLRSLINFLTGASAEELPPAAKELLLPLLTHLYTLEAFDSYNDILEIVAEPGLLNQLANYFFAHNKTASALEYYNLLVQENKIHAGGYRNLVLLTFYEKKSVTGLDILRQSLKAYPGTLMLYGLWFEHSSDITLNKQYKAEFDMQFPAIKGLSFIKAIQ